jgi:uncharacterized protein (TIGR00251 family)
MPAALIHIRVIPRARRTEIAGRRGAAILVRLAAPPVDGAANAALIAYLAERLGLPQRHLTLARGASGRDKTVAVDGLSSADVGRRLGLDEEPTG